MFGGRNLSALSSELTALCYLGSGKFANPSKAKQSSPGSQASPGLGAGGVRRSEASLVRLRIRAESKGRGSSLSLVKSAHLEP